MKNTNKGFTLIELLVVLAIVATLSSVVIASLNSARSKAKDVTRKTDVETIAKALNLYRNSEGDWMEAGSGCGNGDGNGWFNDVYSGQTTMAQCLVNADAAPGIIIDPSGDTTSNTTVGNAYMKYSCTEDSKPTTYVYAKLETLSQNSAATNGTCCSTCDSGYGMNYYLKLQ